MNRLEQKRNGFRYVLVVLICFFSITSSGFVAAQKPAWKTENFARSVPEKIEFSRNRRIKLINILGTRRWRHPYKVNSVAFGPNVTRALSAGIYLKLWEVESGKEILTWKRKDEWSYSSVALSPEGKMALAANRNSEIEKWDLQKEKQVDVWKKHEDEVTAITFGIKGNFAVSGGKDRTIRIWRVTDGKQVHQMDVSGGFVTSIAVAPDGTRILSGDSKGFLKLWDARDGSFVRKWRVSDFDITALDWGTEQKILFGGENRREKGTVHLWHMEKAKQLGEWSLQKKRVRDVAFSPFGKIALAGDFQNNVVKLWAVQSAENLTTTEGHKNTVIDVAFSPEGKYVLSGDQTGVLKLWDVKAGTRISSWNGHEQAVNTVSFSPDGLAVSGSSDQLKLWNVQHAKNIEEWPLRGDVNDVAFGRGGKYIAAGTGQMVNSNQNNTLSVINTETSEQTSYGPFSSNVNTVEFSEKGDVIFLGSDSGVIKKWSVKKGKVLHSWQAHKKAISTLKIRNGIVMTGGGGDKLKQWKGKTGKLIKSWKAGQWSVNTARFLPGGNRVISEGGKPNVKLWSVKTGSEVDSIPVDGDPRSMDVHGDRLAVGNADTTVMIYRLKQD